MPAYVSPGGVLSNFVDPNIIGEIRVLRDILAGVEPEKKVPKRKFESSHRAIPHVRFSNPGARSDDAPSKIIAQDDDPKKEGRFAA